MGGTDRQIAYRVNYLATQDSTNVPIELSKKWQNKNTSSFTDAAYILFAYLWW